MSVFNLCSYLLSIDKFTSLHEEVKQFHGSAVSVASRHSQDGRRNYCNAFDIPRHCLLDQLARMRANFFQPALSRIQLTGDSKNFSYYSQNSQKFWSVCFNKLELVGKRRLGV